MTHSERLGRAAVGEQASFTSYSRNCEDVILHRLFPREYIGFYVDVGAGHPRFENDLYAFYRRGWSGINIEPNETLFALLQQMRPRDLNLAVALSDTRDDRVTYYEVEPAELSTCDEAQARAHAARGRAARPRAVPVATLAAILEDTDRRQIDVLKVDVEGFEEKVLGGNDWQRFRPSVVLVEATYPESRQRRPTKIRGFMEQRGYRHVHFDGLNDFYLEHLVPVPDDLTLPPNVFDGYVPAEIADLREQVRTLQDDLTAAESRLCALREDASASAAEMEEALRAAETLAAENRRLGHQATHLAAENRRLQSAAGQMRTELLAMNRLLEPMHAWTERMGTQRLESEAGTLRAECTAMRARLEAQERETAEIRIRLADTSAEAAHLRTDHQRQQAEIARRDTELHETHRRLRAVHASRSWLVTRPLRVAARLVRRLTG